MGGLSALAGDSGRQAATGTPIIGHAGVNNQPTPQSKSRSMSGSDFASKVRSGGAGCCLWGYPGIDRPLRRPQDFRRFVGERVRVKAHAAVGGRRRFRGILEGFADDLIRVACDGRAYEIHLENLKKANLDR